MITQLNIRKIIKKINLTNIFLASIVLTLILCYVFFSIPYHLGDDHGIIITAGIQVSQGTIPGVDFVYPHGILSPIILGTLIKIFSYFGFTWLIPYYILSILIFIFLIYSLKELFFKIFSFSYLNSFLSAIFITPFIIFRFGGFYFDYFSLIICINQLLIFESACRANGKKNNFLKGYSFRFYILGILSFINPFLIKVTSAYFSLTLFFGLCFLLIKEIKFKKYKFIIIRDYFLGIITLPFVSLIFLRFKFDIILKILFNLFSPLFLAVDLDQYSLFQLPHILYLIPLFSYFLLVFLLSAYQKEKKIFFINRIIFGLFIFQYINAWGRDQTWLMIMVSILVICSFLKIFKLKLSSKINLIRFCIVFVVLFSLNVTSYLRARYNIFKANQYRNKERLLDLSNTNLATFKVYENYNAGLSQDVIDVSLKIKELLEKGSISNYSYIDDNAFLIPLITETKPMQPFSFYQLNKTIFIQNPPNPNKYNLGKPDRLVVCLPFDAQKSNKKLNHYIENGINNRSMEKLHPLYYQLRFLRETPKSKNFSLAKDFYFDFLKKYNKNYFPIYSNNSCVIFQPRNK